MFSNLPLSRRVKRKQIDAIIKSDPTTIQFTRSTFATDGAGGKYKVAPVTLPAQFGKLIGQSAANQLPLRQSEDGRSVQASMILIMSRSADVQQGDTFMKNGLKCEVIYVHAERSITTRVEVMING